MEARRSSSLSISMTDALLRRGSTHYAASLLRTMPSSRSGRPVPTSPSPSLACCKRRLAMPRIPGCSSRFIPTWRQRVGWRRCRSGRSATSPAKPTCTSLFLNGSNPRALICSRSGAVSRKILPTATQLSTSLRLRLVTPVFRFLANRSGCSTISISRTKFAR